MPNLRPGEKMQRCESSFHSQIRKQKYYIKRKYYNELEQHFCSGCCEVIAQRGILKYTIGEGYMPIGNITIPEVIAMYRERKETE